MVVGLDVIRGEEYGSREALGREVEHLVCGVSASITGSPGTAIRTRG